MVQKDTKCFESLLKVKWLKGMVRECIIITWNRAISSQDALQLAKIIKLLPLREYKVGHWFMLRRGEINSIRKVDRGLPHNRDEL